MCPPPAVKAVLNPAICSRPATKSAARRNTPPGTGGCLASHLPAASLKSALANDVRQMNSEPCIPVRALAPAVATISGTRASTNVRREPSATAEFTMPTTAATRSLVTSRCTAGTPVSGPAPSSASTRSTRRPPRRPSCRSK